LIIEFGSGLASKIIFKRAEKFEKTENVDRHKHSVAVIDSLFIFKFIFKRLTQRTTINVALHYGWPT